MDRRRAWQREQAAAPRYVGNELAGTRQAAAHHHQTAALRAAEADHATDPADRARLQREAADARALADTLDRQVTALEDLDRAYLRHRVHTAATRAHAEISERILADRHTDADEPEQRVTAEEWLAAHRAALADDEQHRPVTEDDINDADATSRRAPDTDGARGETTLEDAVEPDLREIAAGEPRQTHEDETRVLTADEVMTSTERARRVLHDITAREAYDQRADEDERAAELGRWHDADHPDDTATDTAEADDGPALVRGQPGDPGW